LTPVFTTQLAIKWLTNFPPHLLSASALPGETKPTKYCIHIQFHLFRFSQVVQKQTFSDVEARKIISWKVVSKMFAPKIIKICQFFFKSQSIMLGMLFDVFLFISTHISLVLLSRGSAETDTVQSRIMNGHLMASCARNIRPKNYYNWISLLQVTINNVRDVFFETQCIMQPFPSPLTS